MTYLLKRKYLGFTILLLTITLLLISTFLILFAARYSALQQKIISDSYINQQTFEAAEAGIEAAIPYFQNNYSAIIATASNGYLQAYSNSDTQNVSLASGAKYSFAYSNPEQNNYQLITITATGTSADGNTTRNIVQQIQAYSSIIAPGYSLITKGNVFLANNSSINNTQSNININAGESVNFDNSASTTTSSGVSSNSSSLGSDVTQNNSSLSSMSTNEFFQSIFGANQSTIESQAAYVYTNDEDTSYDNLNGVTGATIWINQTEGSTAKITNNIVIGSLTTPVIIIVNGNLEIRNSVIIYGLIFILNSTHQTEINNSAIINGAIVSTGNISFDNIATLNYNASVLTHLPTTGGTPSYITLPGSWRNF